MRKAIILSLLGLSLWALPAAAEEAVNLIENASFEDYSCNMFGCQFSDWTTTGGYGSGNSADKLDGEVSLYLNPTTMAIILDQEVSLSDNDYAAGAKFTLTLNYKVQSMPEGSSLALDCYWEAAAGGNQETIEAHESETLRVALEAGSGWQQKVITTTKPAKSSKFRVRVKVPKNAKVLFDHFTLYYTPSTDPYIEVSPGTLNAVETTLGNEVAFQTVHIRHGNLTGPTTFELSYTDASQFRLSQSSLAADQSECDLIITYAPTSAGTHVAVLNIDNLSATSQFKSISLKGVCVDPSAKPEVTVTPSVVPDFEVIAGGEQKQTVTVNSANCTDFIYLRVDHITGAAFTIDGTMLSKNSECTVTVYFKPQEAGIYQSTLTVYSQLSEFEPIVLTLNGEGKAATPETVDWSSEYVWDATHALTYLYEPFDNITHNRTLQLEGWQNVADAAARPWWGFDEAETSPVMGTGKYAKATSYQFAKESTGDWTMTLVTPALDYKHASKKVFSFDIMAQYLPEEGENRTQFEIFYIDPYSEETVFFQNLTESFSIPKSADEELTWITFELDLTPYSATMADVFHIAFRYTGPNGIMGEETYYIDNVRWGSDEEGVENVQRDNVPCTKVMENGVLYIMYKGTMYNVQGVKK